MHHVNADGSAGGSAGLSASRPLLVVSPSGYMGPRILSESLGSPSVGRGALVEAPAGAPVGPLAATSGHVVPAGGPVEGSARAYVDAEAVTNFAASAPGAAAAGNPRPAQGPPLARPVAVLPQRVPSRREERRGAPPVEISGLSPDFQFTEKPSWLRRVLVILIVACVSPSLLKEDPFPPLKEIIARQAPLFRSG
ncbi:hypothetical protein, conserved [Eimeria acervulina]|uniref:Uncharacterized protein n=1 Tax=Eimeria acervulina TaxID=5801 RepID=U6GGG4_EIMAC|nr:hypothetical protein, conserved [Eimeria acervulina]CDI78632.1 hypothetical protein, conserved [Eimeria acervulina]